MIHEVATKTEMKNFLKPCITHAHITQQRQFYKSDVTVTRQQNVQSTVMNINNLAATVLAAFSS